MDLQTQKLVDEITKTNKNSINYISHLNFTDDTNPLGFSRRFKVPQINAKTVEEKILFFKTAPDRRQGSSYLK